MRYFKRKIMTAGGSVKAVWLGRMDEEALGGLADVYRVVVLAGTNKMTYVFEQVFITNEMLASWEKQSNGWRTITNDEFLEYMKLLDTYDNLRNSADEVLREIVNSD